MFCERKRVALLTFPSGKVVEEQAILKTYTLTVSRGNGLINAMVSIYRLAALEHRFPWAGCSVLGIVIENLILSAVTVWKNPLLSQSSI